MILKNSIEGRGRARTKFSMSSGGGGGGAQVVKMAQWTDRWFVWLGTALIHKITITSKIIEILILMYLQKIK